ncbi:Abi family protein [Paenibacillus sp. WLX1005]|uniref:Abi family protein n=1 Tax=Paenibacillus sp. WLX1005 TaxID=3243766 RepID=UPI0039841BBC
MNTGGLPLKPAISIEQQILLLESRGLIIPDHNYAKKILQQISYYRFTGYLLPFKNQQGNYRKHTYFQSIVNIAHFDSALRLHLFKLCEHIEIKMRATLSYYLAMKHVQNSLFYKEEQNFNFQKISFDSFSQSWQKSLSDSREIFIQHYRSRYGGQYPIWVAIEVLTFSSLSILYSNLHTQDQRLIAKEFNLKTNNLLRNWLHALSVIRNKCAHFGRLYFTLLDKDIARSFNARELHLNAKKLFSLIFSAKYLVQDLDFWQQWVDELENLIITYSSDIDLDVLGFIPDWKHHLMSVPSDIN